MSQVDSVWGAQAACVLAIASRNRELFFRFAQQNVEPSTGEVHFGEPPKPARETRALPRGITITRCAEASK
jgi:hypothetical protein